MDTQYGTIQPTLMLDRPRHVSRRTCHKQVLKLGDLAIATCDLTLTVAPCPANARDALAVVSATIQTPGFISTCTSSSNQFRPPALQGACNSHVIVVTRSLSLPCLMRGFAAQRLPLAIARAAVRHRCCATWLVLARPARKLLTLPRHGR